VNIEQGIVAYLNGQMSPAGGIGPGQLAQVPVLPAITFSRIDTEHVSSHSGSSSLDYARFQFDVWATSYAGAHDVGETLTNALDMVKGTWGTVEVQLSDVVNGFDQYEPVTGYHRFIVEAIIWWRAAA
jgi:hypothetical protein